MVSFFFLCPPCVVFTANRVSLWTRKNKKMVKWKSGIIPREIEWFGYWVVQLLLISRNISRKQKKTMCWCQSQVCLCSMLTHVCTQHFTVNNSHDWYCVHYKYNSFNCNLSSWNQKQKLWPVFSHVMWKKRDENQRSCIMSEAHVSKFLWELRLKCATCLRSWCRMIFHLKFRNNPRSTVWPI